MPSRDAATKLSIERRIELRKEAGVADVYDEMVRVSPDELEELLDRYEHGGFSTREPKS